MKQTLKDDIYYTILSAIMVSLVVVISFVWLAAFSHLSEKDKEDIIILQMMGQQQ